MESSLDFVVKNYRCFSSSKPVRFSLRPGFTALVGPNNSGKSTLLKMFVELRSMFSAIVMQCLRTKDVQALSLPSTVSDPRDLLFDGNELDAHFEVSTTIQCVDVSEADSVAVTFAATLHRANQHWVPMLKVNGAGYTPNQIKIGTEATIFPGPYKVENSLLSEIARILGSTLYIGPFRNALNLGGMSQYYDIDTGQLFIQRWRQLKGSSETSDNEVAFEVCQDIRSLLGFTTFELNAGANDETLRVVADGKAYNLIDMGSGVTQLVLSLVNAAIKRPAFILIDEPELNLHPSLQIDFLTALASYADKGIVFCTHSYGLARAVADRTYSVCRNEEGIPEVHNWESTPRLSELLGEMNYSGYQQLGCEQVLLCEGPSDVRVIRQFLRWRGNDHKLVLIPLGGSSLINAHSEEQLAEIKRIAPTVRAIIDSERSSSTEALAPNRQAFAESCAKLDIQCLVLERRSLENYLTVNAIRRIKGPKYRALQPLERLKECDPAWGKEENWRIAKEMSPEDLEGSDLGKFLQEL